MTDVFTFDPVIRGDSAQLSMQFAQQDLFTREVSLIDLTPPGTVVALSIDLPDPAQDLIWTTAVGLTLDPGLSIVTRTLSPADTQSLPLGEFPGRYRITYPDGRVETLLHVVVPVQD